MLYRCRPTRDPTWCRFGSTDRPDFEPVMCSIRRIALNAELEQLGVPSISVPSRFVSCRTETQLAGSGDFPSRCSHVDLKRGILTFLGVAERGGLDPTAVLSFLVLSRFAGLLAPKSFERFEIEACKPRSGLDLSERRFGSNQPESVTRSNMDHCCREAKSCKTSTLNQVRGL